MSRYRIGPTRRVTFQFERQATLTLTNVGGTHNNQVRVEKAGQPMILQLSPGQSATLGPANLSSVAGNGNTHIVVTPKLVIITNLQRDTGHGFPGSSIEVSYKLPANPLVPYDELDGTLSHPDIDLVMN